MLGAADGHLARLAVIIIARLGHEAQLSAGAKLLEGPRSLVVTAALRLPGTDGHCEGRGRVDSHHPGQQGMLQLVVFLRHGQAVQPDIGGS
eukprot:scaffold206885_cov42-Prasinocladus_malaysianus.AAC.2